MERPGGNNKEISIKQQRSVFSAGGRGFRASLVAQLAESPLAMQETLVWFLNWKIPCRSDKLPTPVFLGFPSGSDGKESACNAVDLGSIPGLRRSPGGGHGKPLQYSCLENPHGQRSLEGYSPWGLKESDVTEWQSTAQHKNHRIIRHLSDY